MKPKQNKRIVMILLSLLCTLLLAVPAYAATLAGSIDSIDAEGIKGWAWNSESMDEAVTVEFHIFADESTTETKTISVTANNYNEELGKKIGDGYHFFTAKVNWSELTGTTFQVKAYAVSGEERLLLPGTSQYKKQTTAAPKKDTAETTAETIVAKETEAAADPAASGPGVKKPEETKPALTEVTDSETGTKGESLGKFTTTAYCNCSKCSSGFNRTYSGTIPKPKHTISADLNVFPIGTKLMIGDTIYTVEDKGSGVNGRKLDIFFGSHAEALAYGMKTVEVFAVE